MSCSLASKRGIPARKTGDKTLVDCPNMSPVSHTVTRTPFALNKVFSRIQDYKSKNQLLCKRYLMSEFDYNELQFHSKGVELVRVCLISKSRNIFMINTLPIFGKTKFKREHIVLSLPGKIFTFLTLRRRGIFLNVLQISACVRSWIIFNNFQ